MSNNVPLPCRSSRQPMLPATLAHGELASHAVESSSRPQPRNPDAQATPPTRSPTNDACCDRPTTPNYFNLACCVTTRSAMPVPRNGGSLRIISHAPSKAHRSSQASALRKSENTKTQPTSSESSLSGSSSWSNNPPIENRYAPSRASCCFSVGGAAQNTTSSQYVVVVFHGPCVSACRWQHCYPSATRPMVDHHPCSNPTSSSKTAQDDVVLAHC